MRLLVAVGIPMLVLAMVELALRLANYGYPAGFLLPSQKNGETFYLQNNRFGWRFFGPQLARLPYPTCIPKSKSSDTVRIFVFGESAAFGDPLPDFGLPRMLQVLLSLRYPGVHFEVVNAAMTAINSNVILPIANDCSLADGDIWVIYMGNNEVVGPFGSGTVFGRQTAPWPMIRMSIAIQETKIGQLLGSASRWIKEPADGRSEWAGMAMFVHQHVRADDPRMGVVYSHFQRNLSDMIAVGQRKGVGIVISTVAVNLKDCAPFASSYKPTVPLAQREELERLCELGSQALEAGNLPSAWEALDHAEQIDGTFAEVHFLKAKCERLLNHTQSARNEFGLARDLDVLRFRCDSTLNELIRRTVSDQGDKRILLADSEEVFAQASPGGVPGNDCFYEHVHPNFHGNYLLATTIATQVQQLLPQKVVARANAQSTWPSESDCARRLGWSDNAQLRGLSEIYGRLAAPPFTAQSNHKAQLREIKEAMDGLTHGSGPAGTEEARRICEQALQENPDDAFLHQQLALLDQQTGDLNEAIAEVKQAVALLPGYAEAWAALGVMQAQASKAKEASAALRQAVQLDPMNVLFLRNFALAEVMLGDRKAAIQDFHRALELSPHYGPAWLGLGTVLEQTGRGEEATNCFRKALTYRVQLMPNLMILAHFYQNRGWFDGASVCYENALKLNPGDARLYAEAEQNLQSWAHQVETAPRLGAATEVPPASLWPGSPNLMTARLNLGVLLADAGRREEALREFEKVGSTNPIAIRYLQSLQTNSASWPGQPATQSDPP
jgi:tetratricopeptide (TPR) repeat protein